MARAKFHGSGAHKYRTPKNSGATSHASGKKVQKSPKIHKVMSEFKSGKLHIGSKTGPKVKSRKQAIAIALSEARKRKI